MQKEKKRSKTKSDHQLRLLSVPGPIPGWDVMIFPISFCQSLASLYILTRSLSLRPPIQVLLALSLICAYLGRLMKWQTLKKIAKLESCSLFNQYNKHACGSFCGHSGFWPGSSVDRRFTQMYWPKERLLINTTVRSGAEERMFWGARLDVLIFRLRSYHVLISYSAECNGPNFYKTLTHVLRSGWNVLVISG